MASKTRVQKFTFAWLAAMAGLLAFGAIFAYVGLFVWLTERWGWWAVPLDAIGVATFFGVIFAVSTEEC